MTAGGPAGISIGQVTSGHAAELKTFNCRIFKQPWTNLVEEAVQNFLAPELAAQSASAIGVWDNGTLCAVAAWRVDEGAPPICHSLVVAVRNGYLRRGHGRRVKEALVAEARNAGASAVVSEVHWDNQAMIELNASLGANVERIAGDLEYCRCIIPL